jgi:hypothetical protein
MKKEQWKQLEDFICEKVKEIDPYAKRTPGSGNKGRKHDVFTSCGLAIECKCYQKKNVWDVDWLTKCESEVPLHSDKIAIVVTENKDKKKHVHLTFEDFWAIYKEYLKRKE